MPHMDRAFGPEGQRILPVRNSQAAWNALISAPVVVLLPIQHVQLGIAIGMGAEQACAATAHRALLLLDTTAPLKVMLHLPKHCVATAQSLVVNAQHLHANKGAGGCSQCAVEGSVIVSRASSTN